jgi:hypothetical protein
MCAELHPELVGLSSSLPADASGILIEGANAVEGDAAALCEVEAPQAFGAGLGDAAATATHLPAALEAERSQGRAMAADPREADVGDHVAPGQLEPRQERAPLGDGQDADVGDLGGGLAVTTR